MIEISPRTIATKSLSKLDAKLHVQMRIELRHLQQRMGTTSIYVTHDQTEAMGLSDRIMVMSKGLLSSLEPLCDLPPPSVFICGRFHGNKGVVSQE